MSALKIHYTVKFTIELDTGDYLTGVNPKDLVREMYDEDPKQLFSDSEAESIVVGKIEEGDAPSLDDEDDDQLTILEDDALGLED